MREVGTCQGSHARRLGPPCRVRTEGWQGWEWGDCPGCVWGQGQRGTSLARAPPQAHRDPGSCSVPAPLHLPPSSSYFSLESLLQKFILKEIDFQAAWRCNLIFHLEEMMVKEKFGDLITVEGHGNKEFLCPWPETTGPMDSSPCDSGKQVCPGRRGHGPTCAHGMRTR